MTRASAEVVVVGGGPAGASTAFFLARAGCDVLVVDRATFPRDKACSEYLSPQTAGILREMGALAELERGDSACLEGMRITAPNGASFTGSFAAVRGFPVPGPGGLAVRRTILDALLLSRARDAGARLIEGVAVRDLERDAAGRIIGVSASKGERRLVLRAPLVVGADGLRSVVARRAHLGAHGRWPRRTALVAHYRGVRLPGPVGDMHVFRDGYAGFAPVGKTLTNVALVVPASRAASMAGNPSDFMSRELDRHPETRARLVGAERATSVRVTGPFNWRAPVGWRPGLALVGDAADFFDPFTGEGIYAALRGGLLLANYALEACRAVGARRAAVALEAYDRCRRHEFRGKWLVERLIGGGVASPAVMNLAAAAFANRPELAHLLVGVTGDFVPASEVLRPRYILALLAAAIGAASVADVADGARRLLAGEAGLSTSDS